MARPLAPVKGVYERVPGSQEWHARYRQDGKLVRKSFGGDRKAAIDWVQKTREVRRSGEGLIPTTATQPVRTALELAAERDAAARAASADGVLLNELCVGLREQIINDPERYRDQDNPPHRIQRIQDKFGTRVASGIRPHEIRAWLDSLKVEPRPKKDKDDPAGKGRKRKKKQKQKTLDEDPNPPKKASNGTWNRYKSTFSALYVYGKEKEIIACNNPVREFKRRKEPDGVIRYLDPREETRMRYVLDADVAASSATQPVLRQQRLHRIYELDIALGIGVRRGEQYRVTWPCVNYDRREILIPKTKFGPARIVQMNDDVVKALRGLEKLSLTPREWKKGRPSKVPAECIFSIFENRTWFTSCVSRAKVKGFRWHDLRHTFCSRLIQRGVNLKVVQILAGHRTIAMTARYAHLAKTNLVEAVALLNRNQDTGQADPSSV